MLNGKKIMGWRPGSTPQLYLEYVLKQRGVDRRHHQEHRHQYRHAGARRRLHRRAGSISRIFNEPNMSKLEKAGQAHMVASIGKEVGRADYTLFFAKKSWLEKNPDLAQKWTNAIARGAGLDEDRERKGRRARRSRRFSPASRSRTTSPS